MGNSRPGDDGLATFNILMCDFMFVMPVIPDANHPEFAKYVFDHGHLAGERPFHQKNNSEFEVLYMLAIE